MSLEENKAIIRSLFEVFNNQNLALLDDLMALDYVNHTLQIRGLETLKQFETMIFNTFPDWNEAIEDIITEGDKVCVRYKVTGTHTGEFRGYLPLIGKKITLAPTSKSITFTAVSIYRIVDGKVVEGWHVYDVLDFYKQLGVIEYTEKAKKVFREDVESI